MAVKLRTASYLVRRRGLHPAVALNVVRRACEPTEDVGLLPNCYDPYNLVRRFNVLACMEIDVLPCGIVNTADGIILVAITPLSDTERNGRGTNAAVLDMLRSMQGAGILDPTVLGGMNPQRMTKDNIHYRVTPDYIFRQTVIIHCDGSAPLKARLWQEYEL